jgi:hypothetical protein
MASINRLPMSVVTNWLANATKQPLNKGIARQRLRQTNHFYRQVFGFAFPYLKGIWREIP